MNTTTETTKKSPFQRAERIGMNVITFEPNTTRFFEFHKLGEIKTKKGKVVETADVTDLETGETGTLFLSGGLLHIIEQAGKLPIKMEVVHKGKQPAEVMINGELQETMVNQYEAFKLKN